MSKLFYLNTQDLIDQLRPAATSLASWIREHPTLALTSVAGGLFTFYLAKDVLSRHRNLPPGPIPIPFLGSVHRVNFDRFYESLSELSDQYGDIYTIYFFGTPYIVLNSVPVLKEILQIDRYAATNRAEFTTITEAQPSSKEIFHEECDDSWKEAYKSTVGMVKKCTGPQSAMPDRCVAEAEFLISSIMASNSKPLDPKEVFVKGTTNLVFQLVYGLHYEDRDHPDLIEMNRIMTDWYQGMFATVIYDLYFPARWTSYKCKKEKADFYAACYAAQQFNVKMMDKMDPTLDMEKPNSMYGCYRAKGEARELLQDKLTFLSLDGVDNGPVLLQWAVLYLAYFPDIQKQLQKLTDEVVGRGNKVTLEHRARLGLVESFNYECQRYSCFLPSGPQQMVDRENIKCRGYSIPTNVMIIPNYAAMYKKSDGFPEPLTFKVDRFINAEGQFKKPDAVYTFGWGVRSCPGEQFIRLMVFTLVANLLHHFDISLPSDRPKPSLERSAASQGFWKPNDFELIFKPR